MKKKILNVNTADLGINDSFYQEEILRFAFNTLLMFMLWVVFCNANHINKQYDDVLCNNKDHVEVNYLL